MRVVNGPPGKRGRQRRWRLAVALVVAVVVGTFVFAVASASPGIVAGTSAGVAVATLLVQVFTWLDGSGGSGTPGSSGSSGLPPSASA
jgi:hypothetical protein